MALRDVVTNLQSKAAALSGVKEAPIDPPESANQFPFAVTYVRSGEWHAESAGFSHALVTLVTEIHIARQILPLDVKKALPYFETFLQSILNDLDLGNTVDTVPLIEFEFGGMSYGEQDGVPISTIGWRFTLSDVKVTILAG